MALCELFGENERGWIEEVPLHGQSVKYIHSNVRLFATH